MLNLISCSASTVYLFSQYSAIAGLLFGFGRLGRVAGRVCNVCGDCCDPFSGLTGKIVETCVDNCIKEALK